MNRSRCVLFLYPEGIAPGAGTGLGRTAIVLREQGAPVEELTIDDSFDAVLDRLAHGMIPVVVKPEP
ncbi:MAG: hypothetical protein DWQ09_16080 [Proteobacteria bacterium]|nr:MAG: hypothetical protein DWQ09_16080 [Pseudomonadota bacterium]